MKNIQRFIHYKQTGQELISLNKAAEELGISRWSARQLLNEGILMPATGGGRGKAFEFDRNEIEELREEMDDFVE